MCLCVCVGGSGSVFNLWFESGHSVCQVLDLREMLKTSTFFGLFWNCISFSIRIPSGSTNAMTAGAFAGKGAYSDDPLPWNGPARRAAYLPVMISNTHTDKAYTRSMWCTNRLQSFHHLYKMLNCRHLAQSNTHFLDGRWRHIHIGVGGEETGFYTGTQFRYEEAKRRRTNKKWPKWRCIDEVRQACVLQ